jgi:hypothetical protein
MNRSTLRIAITILTLITAVVHLSLAFVLEGTMQILFILNGISYLVLLWALLRPPAFLRDKSTLVHLAFIAFVLTTIIGYFVVNGFKADDYLGLFDKLVEVLLVISLFLHMRQNT